MSSIDSLREEVCEANRQLPAHRLVTLTWGNVSGLTPELDRIVIKPSGVAYERLKPADMVVVGLDGKVLEGSLRPSTDSPTHAAIYRAFAAKGVRGITHTHSTHATAFAQARRSLECLGTTHADHFCGRVPVTRPLGADDMADYEAATGRSIIEAVDPANILAVPGVLVAGHAPFVWAASALKSVENAVALEAICEMAILTLALNPAACLEPHVIAKHHERKHGAGAYYGQHKRSDR
jgi:L-ribulose-5-phosphate 4-epimerase